MGTTGLYHTAILYPTRAALAEAFRRILMEQASVNGAADHGVSESIYLRDPDGNGVELYSGQAPGRVAAQLGRRARNVRAPC